MPSSSTNSRPAVAARDFFAVAVSCAGAFELFYWAFGQWATSRFSELWAAEHPIIGTMGPFLGIALLCGSFVGALLAVLIGVKSRRIAGWAAIAACVLSLGAAIVAGGITWATSEGTVLVGPSVAAGLVLGAMLVRKVRHA